MARVCLPPATATHNLTRRHSNRVPTFVLLLRSIFFTLLLPGTVTVLIPSWILSSRSDSIFSNHHALSYFGFPLVVIGAAGLLWCIWEFFSAGRGTLAPVDPPKQLVVRGPYRYIRNPMYVSVVTILLGESIFFMSTPIVIEAGVFLTAAYLFVVFYEEPVLRRQFGEPYERYLQTVGRWIPRSRLRAT
jgi:protein-S-isoprenylcysteine O-methyltransferase Ste14